MTRAADLFDVDGDQGAAAIADTVTACGSKAQNEPLIEGAAGRAPAGPIGGRAPSEASEGAELPKTTHQDAPQRVGSASDDGQHVRKRAQNEPVLSGAGNGRQIDDHSAGDALTRSHLTDLTHGWPASAHPVIRFLTFAENLPRSSFWLRPGERVICPETFFRRLHEDLAAGPDGPCAGSAIRDCNTPQTLYGRRRPPLKPR